MAIITVPKERLSTNQMKMVEFCPLSAMVSTILSAISLVEMYQELQQAGRILSIYCEIQSQYKNGTVSITFP
jgi:hypothetical protein